jgi:hypothetical protein
MVLKAWSIVRCCLDENIGPGISVRLVVTPRQGWGLLKFKARAAQSMSISRYRQMREPARRLKKFAGQRTADFVIGREGAICTVARRLLNRRLETLVPLLGNSDRFDHLLQRDPMDGMIGLYSCPNRR